jgi:hypothetical protein
MKRDTRYTVSNPVFIAESFDSRTLANMAIALERACTNVTGSEKHRARRHIANRIIRCAKMGQRTLAAFLQAGQTAAAELRQHKAV